MTESITQFSTVTVPVPLGGKSHPYVPDPAPTLLVELAVVDRAAEEAKIAALLADAEATAASARDAAEAAATATLADAEDTAAALITAAQDEADSLRSAAESEADAIRTAADESVAAMRDALEARGMELDERAAALEILQTDVEERETHLVARLAAVDAEAAEAAALLATAHEEADSVVANARIAAEEILEDARRQAEEDARAVRADARIAAENDPAVEERIAEIESVHRIEVQVLHDREVELLGRIAYLEAHGLTPLPPTDVEESHRHAMASADASPESKMNGRRSDTDAVAIDLEGERADVTVGSDARLNGRHTTSDGRTDRPVGAGPIVTHAPLTEQLSTSAFRVVPENDRRGRRRR